MGTHPIFESDFDCLTEKMHTRLTRSAVQALTRRATMQRGGTLQTPPSFSANYDMGQKYMMGWFAFVIAFTGHLAVTEMYYLKNTGIAIEKNFEKVCSEPSGLEWLDGVCRQKLMAQRMEWKMADEAEDDEDDDDDE